MTVKEGFRNSRRLPTHHMRVTPPRGGLPPRAVERLFRSLGRRLGVKVEYMMVKERGRRRGREHFHVLIRSEAEIPAGLLGDLLARAAPGAKHSCAPLRCPLAAVDYVLKAGRFSGRAEVPHREKSRLVTFTRNFLGMSPRALWAARQQRRVAAAVHRQGAGFASPRLAGASQAAREATFETRPKE
jgi:hypothetical protein